MLSSRDFAELCPTSRLCSPKSGCIGTRARSRSADAAGSADVQRYARMVRADRELKFAGYEVFRFGAAELQAPTAKADVKDFFEALFKRYGVPTN